MTEHWHLDDVERLVAEYADRQSERRGLNLLAHLPLASAAVLTPFIGSSTTTYRILEHLHQSGLTDWIRPPFRPGHAPRLWYLTDLGLALVASYSGCTPKEFAQSRRVRGVDLLGLLPGLPQLTAAYEMLGALAGSQPGPPRLLTWERPWRRRFWRPASKAPGRVSFPFCCVLTWPQGVGAFLLLPDLGTSPPRAWRGNLVRLNGLYTMQPEVVPRLLIATPDSARTMVWRELIAEVSRAPGVAPFRSHVLPWSDLPVVLGQQPLEPDPIRPCECQGGKNREAVGMHARILLARLVGDTLRPVGETPSKRHNIGQIALGLTAVDRRILDCVGRHPFLDPEQISQMLNVKTTRTRSRLQQLIADGLVGHIAPSEVGVSGPEPELIELTRTGLTFVAAGHGLSHGQAVRFNGLAGGGAAQPFGSRSSLVRNLVHTRGVDSFFVDLSRQLGRASDNAALVEWRNAAACARRSLRPDGYGIVQYLGQIHGFFLEYDRGTMRTPGYLKKFAAYYDYLSSGRFNRDYAGFPTILVVAANTAAEERIAQAARAAAVGRTAVLPLLLTCDWRIRDDGNSLGILGSVWRDADADLYDRYCWLGDCEDEVKRGVNAVLGEGHFD